MQFNDTTNNNGIIQMQERQTRLGLGAISGNAAPDYYLDYFTVQTNEYLHFVNYTLGSIASEWKYDDDNHGDYPEETYSCTDSQIDHGLDADIHSIRQVEMHKAGSASDEDWYSLKFQLQKDRAEDRLGEDDGKPSDYFLNGRSIEWNIPVDIAKVDQYRIRYDRHASVFTTSDTTQEPGFDKQFHMILVYGPSMEYASTRPGLAQVYQHCYRKLYGVHPNDKNGLIKLLKQHYLKRARQSQPSIRQRKPSGGSWK